VGIKNSVDVNTMKHNAATELKLNEVALVDVQLNSPVVFDRYKESRGTGGFVIIDRFTNITIAAGMIAEESTSAAVTSGLAYEQRLAAFNTEVAGLVRKYFPEA
jgi:sulfate adenylyltransferase subunit 1 (EFTu-like GTPase family)